MKYRNTKTGFVFESDALCKGDGWEPISSSPTPPEKPRKAEPKEEPIEDAKETAKPKRNTKGKTK